MQQKRMRRARLYQIVEVGASDDFVSRFYDFFSTAVLLMSIAVCMLDTFDTLSERCGGVFSVLEYAAAVFFAADYVMRILTASCAYPKLSQARAVCAYVFSLYGLIDLVSFLPVLIPTFLPQGLIAFRMLRVVRIFRLFRLNAYYDSLNVIAEVLRSKRQQLLSSVFIILVLMLAASLCMYSLEHEAQPDVFRNAFSGIWWSVSTLLTVGYGDIYPVTALGRAVSIVITFLGVGLVAIPTGIISAGFVEQYTRLKELGDISRAQDFSFIRLDIAAGDSWCGCRLDALPLPRDAVAALILRGGETLPPRADETLCAGDVLLLGAGRAGDETPVRLQTLTVSAFSPWKGCLIRDLDLSRRTFVAAVRRGGEMLPAHGDTRLCEGDELLLCSRRRLPADRTFFV